MFGETEKTTRISREAWLKSRKLCITSTMMSNCISSKHPENLLKRIENPVDISHLPFVSRGIQDEQAGVDHLLKHLEKDGIFAGHTRLVLYFILSVTGLELHQTVFCMTGASGNL